MRPPKVGGQRTNGGLKSAELIPIRTIEDLEAEILARTRESLDAAGQDCARLGHVWRELETNAGDGRPAAYYPIVSE